MIHKKNFGLCWLLWNMFAESRQSKFSRPAAKACARRPVPSRRFFPSPNPPAEQKGMKSFSRHFCVSNSLPKLSYIPIANKKSPSKSKPEKRYLSVTLMSKSTEASVLHRRKDLKDVEESHSPTVSSSNVSANPYRSTNKAPTQSKFSCGSRGAKLSCDFTEIMRRKSSYFSALKIDLINMEHNLIKQQSNTRKKSLRAIERHKEFAKINKQMMISVDDSDGEFEESASRLAGKARYPLPAIKHGSRGLAPFPEIALADCNDCEFELSKMKGSNVNSGNEDSAKHEQAQPHKDDAVDSSESTPSNALQVDRFSVDVPAAACIINEKDTSDNKLGLRGHARWLSMEHINNSLLAASLDEIDFPLAEVSVFVPGNSRPSSTVSMFAGDDKLDLVIQDAEFTRSGVATTMSNHSERLSFSLVRDAGRIIDSASCDFLNKIGISSPAGHLVDELGWHIDADADESAPRADPFV